MVDTTLALSEGLRSTPKLYGEKVKDHEPITDWQSGLKVAGKVREECHHLSSSRY